MPKSSQNSSATSQDEKDLLKMVNSGSSDNGENDIAPSKEGSDDALGALRKAYNNYYNKKNATNISWRKRYFNCSFALLFILVFGFIGTTIMVCLCVQDNLAVIVSLVSSIGGLVPSVLILPKTIGDYIFNKNEYDGAKDAIESAKKIDINKK